MNSVMLLGNLGKDPEVRYTGDNMAIANFRLATKGRTKDETEWHTCVAFGKTAEVIEKHVKKGDMILVQGRLQTRKWQDNEGKDRYTTEIVAERMEFAGGSGGGSKPAEAPARQVEDDFEYDQSIPF